MTKEFIIFKKIQFKYLMNNKIKDNQDTVLKEI